MRGKQNKFLHPDQIFSRKMEAGKVNCFLQECFELCKAFGFLKADMHILSEWNHQCYCQRSS